MSQIENIDLENIDWRSSREFFESLSDELRSLDNKEESYDFTWVGKRKSIIEAGAPINKTLRPAVEESKHWDTTCGNETSYRHIQELLVCRQQCNGQLGRAFQNP